MPRVNVRQPRALRLTWPSFHLELVVVRRAALQERLGSLARLNEQPVRTQMLNLGLEGLRVPISNISPCCPNLLSIFLCIKTVLAGAGFVAKAALREALTIHLEAFGPGALARQVLDGRALFLQQSQLGVEGHRCLPLDRLLAGTPCPTFL